MFDREQFLIEYHKTNVIILANRKVHRQSNEPIKTLINTFNICEVRENMCKRVTVGFGFT